MDFTNFGDLITGISYVVSGAAVVATFFPKAEKVGKALGTASKVINFLALNLGNAKNQK
jgi:hypothetical protein